MISLEQIKKDYEELSGKASEICRQLGFAGIGIIWIFNTTQNGISIPEKFHLPLFLICLSLALDLLGYVIGTLTWYIIYLCHHKKESSDDTAEFKDSEWINLLTWILWAIKIALMICAYIKLACLLFDYKFTGS